MTALGIIISSLFALLLNPLGSFSWAEPLKKPSISFSLAYYSSPDTGKIPQFEDFYLAHSFEKGINVILVGQKGHCSGKTGDTFTQLEGDGPDDELETLTRTRLTGKANCIAADNKETSRIAVVGADPSEVHILEAKKNNRLSKDMESKARKLASAAYRTGGFPNIANSAPDVLGIGKTALLLFKSTDESLNFDGLPVIIFNDNAFELDGTCAWSPFFLYVKERLYLAYWAMAGPCCCNPLLLVYDLSGESPKPVTILP